jgi:RNA polymerase sigma factor for flagellar operon FliA
MKAAKQAYEAGAGGEIDAAERDRLLLEQIPQVRYIAARIHDRLPQSVALEDLVHAGVLGLIDALHKYDPGKNVQFKSYAKFRIRGAILDSLRELDWSPRDLRRKARRMENTHRRLKAELGRAASEPELAAAMGMDLEEFYRLLRDLRGLDLGSLQVEPSENHAEPELYRYLPGGGDHGGGDEDPFYLCLHSEMKEMLARAIGELPERERQVLALYYYEELTMKEIGQVLGVGESRISQIHSAALVRVRSQLHDKLETHAKRVPAVAAGGREMR